MQKLDTKINGNAIKILALITMLIDHIGFMLFPTLDILRIIGRISMPLFAYMIAEGCFYTKNRKKHFLLIFGLGVFCQVVYLVAMNSLLMGVLISFSISILIIYAIDNAKIKKSVISFLIAVFSILLALFITILLPKLLRGSGLIFDYGYLLIWLPIAVYYCKNKLSKLTALAVFLIAICMTGGWGLQWYSLISLIPLALYNGKRGKYNIKYLFYIFYPLHLAIISGISYLI